MKILHFDILEGFKKGGITQFENDNLNETYKIYLYKNKMRFDVEEKTIRFVMLDKNKAGQVLTLRKGEASNEIILPVTKELTKIDGVYDAQIIFTKAYGYNEKTIPFKVTIKNDLLTDMESELVSKEEYQYLVDRFEEAVRNIEGFKTEIRNEYLGLENDLNNKYNSFKSEMNDSNDKFKATVNSNIEVFGSQVTEIENDFDEAIANITNGNESATNSEIVQARGGEVNLNKRLDKFDTQLSDINIKSNTSTSLKRPLVVFISDDTRKDDLRVLAPLFEAKGVPCNFACITKDVDIHELSLTSSEIRELVQKGHGIMSHSHTHREMSSLTKEELEIEFSTTREKIREITGRENKAIAYPYGMWNEAVVEVARKYFDYAFSTLKDGYLLNDDILEQYAIVRDVICYDMGAKPRTLDNIKPLIDRCKAEGKMLVYCIHACEFSGEYESNQPLLNSVIDYIKSVGVDIVTHDVALAEKSNVLDIGTFKTQYVKISKSGAMYSNNTKNLIDNSAFFNDVRSNIVNATPLTDFKTECVTRSKIYNDKATGFPENKGGTLLTYYMFDGTDFNFQIYYPVNSKSFYRRDWNRWSNIWNPWQEFKPYNGGLDSNNRNNATPLTDFPIGITNSKISNVNATGFPEDVGGLLVTNYIWEDTDMNFQMYYPQNSNTFYRRNWNRWSNVWSPWSGFIAGFTFRNIQLTGFNLATEAIKEIEVDCSGAKLLDKIIITFNTFLPQGILVDNIVSQNDKVKIRFFNTRSVTINIPNNIINIAVLK